MAHNEMIDEKTAGMLEGLQRRRLMKRAAATALGAAAVSAATTAGLTLGSPAAQAQAASAPTLTDFEVLTFALNLEYLEAEYYLRAVTGSGLPASLTTGTGTAGTVTAYSGSQSLVPWSTTAVAYWAQQIANDELAHVTFLRNTLTAFQSVYGIGTGPIAEPSIDLTDGFNGVAVAGGLGSSFNPFAGEIDFLVGAYLFEDVGVTAYAGAAYLLSAYTLPYAASILAVEAYHSGAIRARLSEIGGGTVTDQISTLRYKLSTVGDLGVLNPGNPFTIVNDDVNALAQRRTYAQVLSIVYGGGTTSGLFFPSGVNGPLNTSASS